MTTTEPLTHPPIAEELYDPTARFFSSVEEEPSDCEMWGCKHDRFCPRPAAWWVDWRCAKEGLGGKRRVCTEHKDEIVQEWEKYHCCACGADVILDGWWRL